MTFIEDRQYIEGLISDLRSKLENIEDPTEQEKFNRIIKKFEYGLAEEYSQPLQVSILPVQSSKKVEKSILEETAIVELNANSLKKRFFSYRSIHDLMINSGCDIVSKEAVEYLIEILEKFVYNSSQFALKIVQNKGKKKITQDDIILAVKHALNE
jgi:histone H3/H4